MSDVTLTRLIHDDIDEDAFLVLTPEMLTRLGFTPDELEGDPEVTIEVTDDELSPTGKALLIMKR